MSPNRGDLVVNGELRVPGDKSVSHRALIFAALAEGTSRVRGLLDSADVRSTASVLRRLGVDSEVPEPTDAQTVGDYPAPTPPTSVRDVEIAGVGLRGLRAPTEPLDCGNSGTTTRLIAGVAAAHPFVSRFVGDESLSRRPMRRVTEPLESMGARVTFDGSDGLPMTVQGGALRSVDWTNDTSSAQVKSALLLAGVVAGVPVKVHAPRPSRDHTERFINALGGSVAVEGTTVTLTPSVRLRSFDLDVPGDPSSAAYFVALASLATQGTLRLPHVLAAPTRDGFFRALVEAGGALSVEPGAGTDIGESTVTYVVRPADLRGISVGADSVPAMIDELPLLACVASQAVGETVVTGAAELRVKESDRISTTVAGLRAIGVDADELPDGFRITGRRGPLRGRVVTHGDHRIAMAFGVLALLPGNEIDVDDPRCVGVSYPSFWFDMTWVMA